MNIRRMNSENAEASTLSGSKNKRSKEPERQNSVNKILKENGGPQGPEPTRYGDWEQKGRCTDF